MGESNSKSTNKASRRNINGFAGDKSPQNHLPTAKSTKTKKSSGKSKTITVADAESGSKALARSRARVPAKISRKKSPYGKIDPSKIKIEEAEVATTTKTPESDTKPEKSKKHRRSRVRVHYVIIAVILALIGGFVGRVAIWEHNYLAAKEGSERAVIIEEVYEGEEEVDDTEPTEEEIVEYQVPANRARYITIRSAGVYRARVQDVGQLASGAIDTPVNIYNVGWYVNSALPGQSGVTVMDGHGGSLGYGIFRNLPNVNLYDEIVIEMGDGVTTYRYVVMDIAYRDISEADAYMPTAFSSPIPGTPSLTIITCTGNWLQASQTYNQRMFVRAVLSS